jgi:hypothetical protein
MNNSAIASAKRRRAGIASTNPPPPGSNTCSVPPRPNVSFTSSNTGSTTTSTSTYKLLPLKDIIPHFDNRITYLETLAKKNMELETELEELKEAFMKLQAFTMEIHTQLNQPVASPEEPSSL